MVILDTIIKLREKNEKEEATAVFFIGFITFAYDPTEF